MQNSVLSIQLVDFGLLNPTRKATTDHLRDLERALVTSQVKVFDLPLHIRELGVMSGPIERRETRNIVTMIMLVKPRQEKPVVDVLHLLVTGPQ